MNDSKSTINPLSLHRRDLIRLIVGASAAASLPRWAWSQPKLAANPFTLGVASGSPRHDGVVLWTRLNLNTFLGGNATPNTALTVHWELARDAGFTQVLQSGQAQASPLLGHAVHVELTQLPANAWFYYRFRQGDYFSPIGRTRTMPAADSLVSSLRFAYASCQRWEAGYYSAYRHMLAEKLDLVLFVGDYIYEYKSKGRGAVRELPDYVPNFADTVSDYRLRYAAYKSDPDLQAMHAACPWILTWDDHEVYNDYAATQGEDLSPNFMQRKAAAYQAYYEHMPLRANSLISGLDSLKTNGELRIYGAFDAGRLARFSVLDTRQYRDAQSCSKPQRGGSNTVRAVECPELFDDKRTLLGAPQEAWLDQSLRTSPARWNIVAQQTLVGRRNYSPSPDPQRAILQTDPWDGYPAARTRMLASIQRHSPQNPVFVGGDIHQNWVGHVKADYLTPKSSAIATEFCGTSLTSTGGKNDKNAERLANNPHFIYAESERRGYGVVELTPTALTTTLRVVDDVTRKDSGVATAAQFVVQSGRADIARVI